MKLVTQAAIFASIVTLILATVLFFGTSSQTQSKSDACAKAQAMLEQAKAQNYNTTVLNDTTYKLLYSECMSP